MEAKRTRALEEAEQETREIGRLLKKKLPPGWGFFLCIADFGPGGREEGFKTYTSSIQRADAIKLLREMADDLEKDPKPQGKTT